MPVARNYNGGSIVYFQGDRGDDVYVLQKGRVILIGTALDTGEEVKTDVQKGEFFGVKSSLGHYPREETAQVLGATNLLVFKQSEFEKLVLQNTRLIMKMLKVFSRQLRDIHRQVRDILKTGAAREPSFELMNVAESFFRSGHIDHCVHAFEKYLEHYPGGRYSGRAKELLGKARKGEMYPPGYAALESVAGHEEEPNDDVMVRDGLGSATGTVEDPFALNAAPAERPPESSISDVFYEGMDSFSKQDFKGALSKYVKCLEFKKLDSEGAEIFSRAHYEKARAEMKLEQLDDATASLSLYLKKYPTGEHVKDSIFQMGVIAETKGNTERAKSLYHKVATMPPPDKITAEARKRLEKLG